MQLVWAYGYQYVNKNTLDICVYDLVWVNWIYWFIYQRRTLVCNICICLSALF